MLCKLHIVREDRILLQHATSLLLHRCRVDLVLVPHVRVLLAPLLKGLPAAHDWASERLLARVDSHMVLQCTI